LWNNRQDIPPLPTLEPLPTAAERAAALIREYIFEGKFLPSTPLPEVSIATALQVSRNTVREAYRTLMNEHLLTYHPHRGVTVRALQESDVRDIYALRRLLELSAIDLVSSGAAVLETAALDEAVAAGRQAADSGNWRGVGTANLLFHAAIVATHRSERTDEFFRRLMTELRLGFLAVSSPEEFHGGFLARNIELHDLLAAARYERARSALERYLRDAEDPVIAAVREMPVSS
jgi:DNA-binding GntR family transcriptional regulator